MGDFGQVASGAMGGAAIGSVVPGVGTAIGAGAGALIGGLAGYFGNDGGRGDQEARLKAYEDSIKNRTFQQLGRTSTAGASNYEGNRAAMIGYLERMARGEGPSLAQNQMREAMDRSTGAQAGMAQAAAGRGMSAGAAFRNAGNNAAAIQTQGARDTTNARVQEQQGALAQLQGAINTGIGQQNQQAQFNAQQQNQMKVQRLDAYLRQQGMNDAQRLQVLQLYAGQIQPGTGQQIAALGGQAVQLAPILNPAAPTTPTTPAV